MRVFFAALLAVALCFSVASARDSGVARKFRNAVPCPATGEIRKPCPGYVIDHKYPLCAGGLDTTENMMWQDVKQSYVKDRIERDLCRFKKQATKCVVKP